MRDPVVHPKVVIILIRPCFTVWKNAKFSLTEKLFRQILYVAKVLLSRNFCQKGVRVNFRDFHTLQSAAKHLIIQYLLRVLDGRGVCNSWQETKIDQSEDGGGDPWFLS